MGTRSSVIIIQDGVEKSYYNQYDGYPSGVGTDVLKQLKAIDKVKDGWDQFKKNCKKVVTIDASKKPSAAVMKKYIANGFYDERVSTRSPEDWYCLLRNLQGADYIPAIMSGKVQHICDGSGFIKDSLFCEYGYVIDLDKMVVEFYKGYQHEPQPGNRFGTQVGEGGYYPCAKVGQIALKGISKDKLALKIMEELYEKASKERENSKKEKV
jgi:hypothetical protein